MPQRRELKEVRFEVRISPTLYSKISKVAAEAGVDRSEFARAALVLATGGFEDLPQAALLTRLQQDRKKNSKR